MLTIQANVSPGVRLHSLLKIVQPYLASVLPHVLEENSETPQLEHVLPNVRLDSLETLLETILHPMPMFAEGIALKQHNTATHSTEFASLKTSAQIPTFMQMIFQDNVRPNVLPVKILLEMLETITVL